VWIHLLRGQALLALGDAVAAERDFTSALEEIASRDRLCLNTRWYASLAHSLRGQAHNRCGRHDLALQDFAASRQHFPQTWTAPDAVTRALKQGDYPAAEAAFARELADFPCEPRIYVERARQLWQRQGRLDRALEDCETALTFDPAFRPALLLRARLSGMS
jgi:tetratricopeptide (TPR) repeat protein